MSIVSRLRLLPRLLACAATIGLGAATYWTARLSYADRLAASPASGDVALATRLAPANARYWLRWADLMEQAGEPSGRAIERAVAASPSDAEVWIRAGLAAESVRDYSRAERCLLRAATLSRQYEPRWALANYYFRRGKADEFWRWFRSAAEWSYGDRRPLFQLAWAMTEDRRQILDTIPENASALDAYLDFLLSANRLDAAAEAAGRLASLAREENRPSLLAYIDRMIEARRPGPALAAWNRLCSRRLLAYEPLDPLRGPRLTNSEFLRSPTGTGFDWRATQSRGISVVWSANPQFLRLSFSGRQPETCQVLAQLVPVAPVVPHVLRFEYRSAAIPPESGLRWKVYDAASLAALPARSPHLSAAGTWTAGTVSFTTPAVTQWVWLMLVYERVPGTMRIEGALSLRRLSLERAR